MKECFLFYWFKGNGKFKKIVFYSNQKTIHCTVENLSVQIFESHRPDFFI